jgi:peptidoglycan hydrolase-like protein with peptidoglycan-binding domain
MSNRIAWVAVAVVVLVVGFLVFRSLRTQSPATAASSGTTQGVAAQDVAPRKKSFADSLKQSTGLKRLSGVQEAQIVLKARGFYDGPIDGNYTEALRDGIMKYQKANGMKVDGYLNDKLYIALGIPIRRR